MIDRGEEKGDGEFFFIVYKLYASETCNGYAGIIYDWYHPSTGSDSSMFTTKDEGFFLSSKLFTISDTRMQLVSIRNYSQLQYQI